MRSTRAKARPRPTPNAVPMTKASSASISVVARCGQMKPVDSQSHRRRARSLGRLKKNGSRIVSADRVCQLPIKKTKVKICSATMAPRPTLRRVLEVASVWSRRAGLSGLPSIVLPFDLVTQIGPDLAVEVHEFGVEANLGDVAGARQVDVVDALEPRRPGGEHNHLVGERDRLFEIVSDEEDGLPGFLPELEQLVLHDLARLHVERGERLVHQQDARIDDPALRHRDALAHAAGELMGETVLEAGETDAIDPAPGLIAR